MTAEITDDYLQALYESVINWGKWGPNDERGTLNYLTDEMRAEARNLIQTGRTVGCAFDFPVIPAPENPVPALHHMVIGGDDPCAAGIPGMEVSADFIGIQFHGLASSHIDALCHVFVDGKMYNGYQAAEVKSTGARYNSIMAAKDGIVGRCVLLDMPRILNTDFVDPESLLLPDHLKAAETQQGSPVKEGDILLVYTGREKRATLTDASDPYVVRMCGLHPECVRYLHNRRISVLGSDVVHDLMPAGQFSDKWPIPIHMCALAGMGLHLLDNLSLGELAQACREHGRWQFFMSIAPLRIIGGTGSPVNPIAVL